MPWQLKISSGLVTDRLVDLADGCRLTLGSDASCDIKLHDAQLRGVRCTIQTGETAVWFSAETGAHLLVVNGKRVIGQQRLQPGDEIDLGATRLKFQLAEDKLGVEAHTWFGDASGTAPVGSQEGYDIQRTDRRLEAIDLSARSAWTTKIVGQRIGPEEGEGFMVLQEIAQDNQGAVFLARDLDHDRIVRLKVLWYNIAADEKAFQRFVRAMRTTIDLKHPNIVRLHAAGRDGEYCYMVTEYLEAKSLRAVIASAGANGFLPWQQVLKIGKEIADALQFADAHKIIHRDINPQSILITAAGTAMLDNLILAKATEGTAAERITISGKEVVIGDNLYSAPEVLFQSTSAVDHRSDIYSLGATLYTALTGRPIFEAETVLALARLIRDQPPRPPRNYQPAIPEDFQRIVLRTLAKRPQDRYQTAAELRRDLNTIK